MKATITSVMKLIFVIAFCHGCASLQKSTTQNSSNKTPHYVGEHFGGGIVFYIYDTGGQSGLIAAATDQSAGISMGCEEELDDYDHRHNARLGYYDGVGKGEKSTIDIIKYCGKSALAAQLCRNYRGGGYDDWFLPSKDELNLMYNCLKVAEIGGFANKLYWSSSTVGPGDGNYQDFGNGTQNHAGWGSLLAVRAIRAF